MDETDLTILETLQRDSRTSLTKISEKVSLSRFAVKDRIQRLFDEHIIIEPTIVVNSIPIGLRRTLFFEFKTNPHEPWLAKLLETTASCDLLEGIAGEYSLWARFRFADDEHFGRVLRRIDDAMGKSYFKKYRVVNAIRIFKEAGVVFKAESKRILKLDQVDLKILEILMNQAKYTKTPLPPTSVQLCRLLHDFRIYISQPAVFNRLSRLEKEGVILRHTVRIDQLKLGIKTRFIVRVRANPNAYDAVAQGFLAKLTAISDLYRTGEEYGLLAILSVRDVSEYNSFLLRLYDSSDVIDTYSTLVLEERKNSSLSLANE